MYSQTIQTTQQLPELIMGSSFPTESFIFALKQVHVVVLPGACQWKTESLPSPPGSKCQPIAVCEEDLEHEIQSHSLPHHRSPEQEIQKELRFQRSIFNKDTF